MSEGDLEKFISLGLSEQKAKETLKNENLSRTLISVIEETEKQGGNLAEIGMLLYHLSANVKPQIKQHLKTIIPYIINKKLNNTLRIDASLNYFMSHINDNVDVAAFEEACGVNVVITPKVIQMGVKNAINKYKEDIIKMRYRFNTGPMLQDIRNTSLKWADFKCVKSEIDAQIAALLGPKTEVDEAPVTKKKGKDTTPKLPKAEKAESSPLTIDEMISKLTLHKPGENFKTDGYVVTPKTEELLKRHLKETGGKVRTRFPPEPNGILHIGHAKAININFGYAAYHGGYCILRYDDTNPDKEEEQFFRGIKDMVEWLGYKPYKITHSSDYFDKLYELAVELIKKDLAFVCHQKQEEMQGFNPPPSKWRNRSVEENLALFKDMKNGKMEEGECTLRMKITLEEGKQDPVAYRIKYLPHPKSGDKWCIYPTYDYTHCLCDSFENITHSLCTKEFQSRRSSYYWLCNALDIYCPVQWEYGRLNMNYTVVSKRKIAKLIATGIVKDWDDPRLFTLTALRRRGIPAEAINRFCAQMGVTGAQSVVDPSMLEASARDVLNYTAKRTMVVIDPLEVEIVSGFKDKSEITVPDFPSDLSKGSHNVNLTTSVFIEQSDFKMVSESGFKRLTLNQPVGLKYTKYLIKAIDIITGPNGEICKLRANAIELTESNKPKAFIHWVSEPSTVTVRLYGNLFIHKNPEDSNEVPNGFLSDINSESLTEKKALADKYLVEQLKPLDKFQFERIGFFSVDPDSSPTNTIFNRTLTLKEDSKK